MSTIYPVKRNSYPNEKFYCALIVLATVIMTSFPHVKIYFPEYVLDLEFGFQ